MRRRKIEKLLRDIIFQPNFRDEASNVKIDNIIPLSRHVKNIIKCEIQKRFDFELKCDVSDLTLDELCDQVYDFVKNSHGTFIPKIMAFFRERFGKNTLLPTGSEVPAPVSPTNGSNAQKEELPKDDHLLNSHEVFARVLSVLRQMVGRYVSPNEGINELREEFAKKNKTDFDETLIQLLSKEFDTELDIATKIPTMAKPAVYSIANQVVAALVTHGKAIDPKVECAGMDKNWVPLRTAMTFKTAANKLNEKYGIKTSQRTISGLKSYRAYEEYVIKKVISAKIETILGGDTLHVKENIQNVFGVTVDYNISGANVKTLSGIVYDRVIVSQGLKDKLLGAPVQKPRAEKTADIEKTNFKSRTEVFGDIITTINCAVSLDTSVQKYTLISELFTKVRGDSTKTKRLERALADFKNKYGIKIDYKTNPDLNIHYICNEVHRVMCERGKSESIKVSLEEMDPLWAILNPAISFEYLHSVLQNDYNTYATVYELSNCRTYDDYVKLINAKKARNYGR